MVDSQVFSFARTLRSLIGYDHGNDSWCIAELAALNPKLAVVPDVWKDLKALEDFVMMRTKYVTFLWGEVNSIVDELLTWEKHDRDTAAVSNLIQCLQNVFRFLKTFDIHVNACDPSASQPKHWISAWTA
eukprot:12010837-Karenia_brevis.AAC.1